MASTPWVKTIIVNKAAAGEIGELGPNDLAKCDEITIYTIYGPGCTAGSVVTETAHKTGYAGLWSPIGTPAGFLDNGVKHANITPVMLALRVRISTAVENGTVTVTVVGR